MQLFVKLILYIILVGHYWEIFTDNGGMYTSMERVTIESHESASYTVWWPINLSPRPVLIAKRTRVSRFASIFLPLH